MKVFMAGGQGIEKPDLDLLGEFMENRLLSYHYFTKSQAEFYFSNKHIFKNILMDSGAFSAWSKGMEIDVDEYVTFCQEHEDNLEHIVNLDVIPASPGQKHITKKMANTAARKGFRNFKKMRKALPPDKVVHVFHQNDDWKWLKKMMHLSDYIGLSPANDRTTPEKIKWLDDCMEYVTDEKGKPLIKFHGFAVTSLKLMGRYPWYSVDSATWTILSGFGKIMMPTWRNGKWDYSDDFCVCISPKTWSPDHYQNLTKMRQKMFEQYIEELGIKWGKSRFEQMPEDYSLVKHPDLIKVSPFLIQPLGLGEPDKGMKWVEVVEERGITNWGAYKRFLNARFYTEFARRHSSKRFNPHNKTLKGMLL